MANDLVPWAAIRAFRAGRLIALDKFPGVRPIGIGDVFYRLLTSPQNKSFIEAKTNY